MNFDIYLWVLLLLKDYGLSILKKNICSVFCKKYSI